MFQMTPIIGSLGKELATLPHSLKILRKAIHWWPNCFGTSKTPPTNDIAFAPIFLMASRYHLDSGVVTCLWGASLQTHSYIRAARLTHVAMPLASRGNLNSRGCGSITIWTH